MRRRTRLKNRRFCRRRIRLKSLLFSAKNHVSEVGRPSEVFRRIRPSTAVADSYVFFGHPDGTFARDNALDRLDATVNAYSLGDFCTAKRGGHQDADTDGICDLCGSAQ